MLAAEQDGPGDAAGVLSLQEQRLGLAVLEAEDLAVAADKDLALFEKSLLAIVDPAFVIVHPLYFPRHEFKSHIRQRNKFSGIF